MERGINLNKVAEMVNVDTNTIVDYLNKNGMVINSTPPDTRLTTEQYQQIIKHFKNVSVNSKSEQIVFTNNKDNYSPFKILGRIDLSAFEDKKENKRRCPKQTQQSIKLIGIVKFFDYIKDYGFIVTNGCNIKDNCQTINGLFDFYIRLKQCSNIIPQNNDWVVFDYLNGRTDNVKKLDFSQETLSIALQYRGKFARIKGRDSRHKKTYNHSILAHIVKHYDNDKAPEIIKVFCDFLSTFASS